MRPSAKRHLIFPHSRHLYVVPQRKVPRAPYVPIGRALHLVDLENLMGGPRQVGQAIACASESYRDSAPVQGGDHVIVGVNPRLAIDAKREWPGAQLRVGGGTNGADLALLEQLADPEWIASRFDCVVIGSGDGIFAPTVTKLRTYGIAVGVVAPEDGLSLRLKRSATFVRLIPPGSVDTREAA